MTGRNRRKAKFISYQTIKSTLMDIPNATDKFMMACCYANGSRIGEVMGLRVDDISITDKFIYITQPVLKKKKKIIPKRSPPISRAFEGWLADIIINYVDSVKDIPDNPRLIRYSKRTAQRRFDKYFNCISHSFRHTRATHCFTILKMNVRQVATYFQISERSLTDWIMRYGHIEMIDIEEHLKSLN